MVAVAVGVAVGVAVVVAVAVVVGVGVVVAVVVAVGVGVGVAVVVAVVVAVGVVLMPLYNHRSSALIGREPLPVTISNGTQRHTAHVHSVGTNKAKKVAKQLTVKARRWK